MVEKFNQSIPNKCFYNCNIVCGCGTRVLAFHERRLPDTPKGAFSSIIFILQNNNTMRSADILSRKCKATVQKYTCTYRTCAI